MKPFKRSRRSCTNLQRRRLRLEHLETRRVLAPLVDVVFLVDESTSTLAPGTNKSLSHVWLEGLVDRLDDTSFASSLASKGITDVRYGLVGFSDTLEEPPGSGIFRERFAHSQVVNDQNFNPSNPSTFAGALFGTASQMVGSDKAIERLDEDGRDSEDGWDAIEHALAEYNFRNGAVPVFVLVQNEEGRVPLNDTLTRDGIFAALGSKNIILNSLVVGENQPNDPAGDPPDALFNLAPYGLSPDLRILGVEADVAASDFLPDGQHSFYSIDMNPVNGVSTPVATTSHALQVSYNGSNTGATGLVANGKSVLIGRNLAGGIGGVLSDPNDYRAREFALAA